MTTPAWRRWLLFFALLALGMGYLAAYALFVARSGNFIVAQRNRVALDYAAGHPRTLPFALKFGQEGHAYLGDGWNDKPGNPGIWMIANDAWVMFSAPPPMADTWLTLNAVVLTTEKARTNHLDVSVNGELLGSWDCTGSEQGQQLVVRVPRRLVAHGQYRLKIHADRVGIRYLRDPAVLRGADYVALLEARLDLGNGAQAAGPRRGPTP